MNMRRNAKTDELQMKNKTKLRRIGIRKDLLTFLTKDLEWDDIHSEGSEDEEGGAIHYEDGESGQLHPEPRFSRIWWSFIVFVGRKCGRFLGGCLNTQIEHVN